MRFDFKKTKPSRKLSKVRKVISAISFLCGVFPLALCLLTNTYSWYYVGIGIFFLLIAGAVSNNGADDNLPPLETPIAWTTDERKGGGRVSKK